MVAAFLSCVLVVVAEQQDVKAAQTPPELIALFEASIKTRQDLVDLAEREHESLKTQRGWSRTAKRRRFKEIRDLIAKLKITTEFYPPELVWPFRVGDVGRFEGTARIQQVVDQKGMLVQFGRQTVYLAGLPTDGVVDDLPASFNGLLCVTGTRTYTTAIGGSNTVPVLEPFKHTLVDVEREYRKWIAKATKKEKPKKAS